MMTNVRAYDPKPPPSEKVDINNFPLKLATVKVNMAKTGIEKFEISLSNEVRGSHLADPVHGATWRSLVLEFDKKLLI